MEDAPKIDDVLTYDQLVKLLMKAQADGFFEDYLRANGLIKKSVRCCFRRMRRVGYVSSSSGSRWRCLRCRKTKSVMHGSFLARGLLDPLAMLKVAFLYVEAEIRSVMFKSLVRGADHSQSLTDWLQNIRNVLSRDLASSIKNQKVGGPGKLIVIDQTVLSKSKYHEGHVVGQEKFLILGIYDVGQKTGTLELIDDHSTSEIMSKIQKHVQTGSTIHTKKDEAYASLQALGYKHRMLNRGRGFVSADGFHTNHIKAYFSRFKVFLVRKYVRNLGLVSSYLDEFMWRERHKEHPWKDFLNALRREYRP